MQEINEHNTQMEKSVPISVPEITGNVTINTNDMNPRAAAEPEDTSSSASSCPFQQVTTPISVPENTGNVENEIVLNVTEQINTGIETIMTSDMNPRAAAEPETRYDVTNRHRSKRKFFIDNYLNPDGTSGTIKRYNLPEPIAWTSGDSIFRSDERLGREYKFIRFSKTLNFDNVGNCWKGKITDEEKKMIVDIHSNLEWERGGNGDIVEWIQFFGKFEEPISSYPDIRGKLAKHMTAPGRCCASCGSTKDLQCDHKNDLYNDPKMFNKSEHTEDDVQTLCRKCNIMKKVCGEKRDKENKRQPPPPHRYLEGIFGVKFTEGNDYLDRDDPNWYKGTYWGDCLEYNKKTTMSM